MTMGLELEAAQTLLELSKRSRTAADIGSTDYRNLMSGLVACSVAELQQSYPVVRPRLFTTKQLDALDGLLRDLQQIPGLYAQRLRTILENTAA